MKIRTSIGIVGFGVGLIVFWIFPLFEWGSFFLTSTGQFWNIILWPLGGAATLWVSSVATSFVLGVFTVGMLALIPEEAQKAILKDSAKSLSYRVLLTSIGVFAAQLMIMGYGLLNTVRYFS